VKPDFAQFVFVKEGVGIFTLMGPELKHIYHPYIIREIIKINTHHNFSC
jgi:hypothetical protein